MTKEKDQKENADRAAEIAKEFDKKKQEEKEFMLGVVMGMNLQKELTDIKSA